MRLEAPALLVPARSSTLALRDEVNAAPLTEYNRPRLGHLPTGAPVIYEGAFRFTG